MAVKNHSQLTFSLEEHFPGLLSPSIQQINETTHQKRVTCLQSANPTEKTRMLTQDLPSSGGDRQLTKVDTPKEQEYHSVAPVPETEVAIT